jgi:hypothetical protein
VREVAVGACALGLALVGGVRAAVPGPTPAAGEWWLQAVDAAGLAAPGPGVPVVIVDRGLDLDHPDFAGRPGTVALNRQAFLDETDDSFHATAMASLVGSPGRVGGLVGIYPQASYPASPSSRAWPSRRVTARA